MARSDLLFFRNVLDTFWEPTVTGRVNNVPKPNIVIAADEDITRVDPQREDLIFVRNGGPVSRTPQSVNWSQKRVESLVTLDIRTTENRVRLGGGRDDNNEVERYGGLRGECERILDDLRKGHKEYDWIDGYEYRDQSEDVGFSNWRGTWEIRLTQIAKNIDPSI